MKIRSFSSTVAALVLAALSVVSLSHAQTETSPTAPPPQGGRFQIYEIHYEGGTGTYKHTDLFRIDTQTGETWKYVFFVADGKIINVWAKVDERK